MGTVACFPSTAELGIVIGLMRPEDIRRGLAVRPCVRITHDSPARPNASAMAVVPLESEPT